MPTLKATGEEVQISGKPEGSQEFESVKQLVNTLRCGEACEIKKNMELCKIAIITNTKKDIVFLCDIKF